MNLTDLIIVYLACGAPFGVYEITTLKTRSVTDAAKILLSFLFWPIFAIRILIQLIENGPAHKLQLSKIRLDEIRLEIERIAFTDATPSPLFEFREVFHRFTGLAEVVNEKSASKFSNDLFDISGHQNKALASRCLARENRRRIEFHRNRARYDFIGLMVELAGDITFRNEISQLVSDLADHLGDTFISSNFESTISHLKNSSPVDLSNTQLRSGQKTQLTVS